MDALNELVVKADDLVWFALLFVLVGGGLFFSIRTGFIQVRRFRHGWNRVFGNFSLSGDKAGSEGMSSFQALATAIAAQVGTGNIAGCSISDRVQNTVLHTCVSFAVSHTGLSLPSF